MITIFFDQRCGHFLYSDQVTGTRRHDWSDPISIKFCMDITVSEIPTIGALKLPIRVHSRAGKTT